MDELNFDSWYRSSYSSVLAAVVVASYGDHHRAEDATNDAFVKALERWSSVSTMQSPSGWVVTVATNNAKSAFRRFRKQVFPAAEPSVLGAAVHRIESSDSELWRAVSSLPDRQRQAIAFRYIEDLSQAETARRMGVSVGTASATLSQARGILRETSTEKDQLS